MRIPDKALIPLVPRFGSIVLLRVASALLLAASPSLANPDLADPGDVIARMNRLFHDQQRELCRYSVQRRYGLRNRHLESDAGMNVGMTYDARSGKVFTIKSSEHLGAISLRVLKDLMEEERAASKENPPRSEISAQHYTFSLDGIDTRRGHRCYRIALKPKSRTKYLLDGKVWIDTAEFALVGVEGHSAKALSFWVGRPFIQIEYEKIGRYWLPSHNRSVAQVRLVGETELNIYSSQYQFPSPLCASTALTPG